MANKVSTTYPFNTSHNIFSKQNPEIFFESGLLKLSAVVVRTFAPPATLERKNVHHSAWLEGDTAITGQAGPRASTEMATAMAGGKTLGGICDVVEDREAMLLGCALGSGKQSGRVVENSLPVRSKSPVEM